MKRVVLFCCFLTLFACKKENIEDVTSVKWVLETAVVTPAMTVNGKTSTDYKNIYGAGSCLASNYTYVFLKSGIFEVSSNGALCDMVANTTNQKWTKQDDQLILNGTSRFTIKGNTIENIAAFTANGIDYTVVYTFKAKTK